MINGLLCVLQGYKHKNEFIITQMPLSTTKTDFWRLVEEHDVHIMVMMNNESEAKVRLYFFNNYNDFVSRSVNQVLACVMNTFLYDVVLFYFVMVPSNLNLSTLYATFVTFEHFFNSYYRETSCVGK